MRYVCRYKVYGVRVRSARLDAWGTPPCTLNAEELTRGGPTRDGKSGSEFLFHFLRKFEFFCVDQVVDTVPLPADSNPEAHPVSRLRTVGTYLAVPRPNSLSHCAHVLERRAGAVARRESGPDATHERRVLSRLFTAQSLRLFTSRPMLVSSKAEWVLVSRSSRSLSNPMPRQRACQLLSMSGVPGGTCGTSCI